MAINPTEADVGRKVIYRPDHGAAEEGVITKIGLDFVFVRYGNESGGRATLRTHLHWPEFLIWSEEHRAWWGRDCRGYTNSIAEAGRYSEPQATHIVANANYMPGVFHEIAMPVPLELDEILKVTAS